MTLSQKFQLLISEFHGHLRDFQTLAAKLGSAHAAQKVIDQTGLRLIEFEHKHGIREARNFLAHLPVTDDLPMFEAMVAKYSEKLDWPALVASGEVAAEDVEQRITARAEILEEAKKSVATLRRIRADAEQRRKKIPDEVLEIAREPDPLTAHERECFEQIFVSTRAERASRSVLGKVLQPLESVTL